jgi:hypothetical protein
MRSIITGVAVVLVPFVVGLSISAMRSTEAMPIPDISDLPAILDAQVTDLNGQTNTVRDMTGMNSVTAVAVFSLNCGNCYGEAVKWEEVARQYESTLSFAALVYTDSAGTTSPAADFARVSGVAVPFATISRESLDAIGLRMMPTTAVLVGDSLAFMSEGANATADLMGWLANRYRATAP